ncbi:MAG: DUF3990 domain-containing protein [Erysipelotrichaceae bacterium]|nr:DUF3990 domain-containing protein [Erysipelotrichaceae bacterium]
MNTVKRLYHTGFEIIPEPDITAGRRNADFGQGFYLSDDQEFSKRWAKQRKGLSVYLNCYELDPDGLNIRHFARDADWFEYIFANRSGQKDAMAAYDVIIGPVANDTLYDTWGIITSGLIGTEQALELLSQGPLYEQTVIKTEKALAALRYVETVLLTDDEIQRYRETVRDEEKQFQEVFLKKLDEIDIG